MLNRLQLTIDDTQWPKLHISGSREDSQGGKVAFDQKVFFDQAYLQFENLLHNQLRPLVEEIIKRRKGAAQTPTQV